MDNNDYFLNNRNKGLIQPVKGCTKISVSRLRGGGVVSTPGHSSSNCGTFGEQPSFIL